MKLWSFIDEVCLTLSGHGIKVNMSLSDGLVLLSAEGAGGHNAGFILTDPMSADPSDAIEESVRIDHLCKGLDNRPMIIARDLWEREKEMMQARILAHCGICRRIFARNCEVRRIGRPEANSFLGKSHSYGGASCRYCYGLYVRNGATGNGNIKPDQSLIMTSANAAEDYPVAVAEFSNARKWIKDGREIRSYEWIRYASLPGMRISGGMGKLLKRFMDDIRPDDIMSYADMEWSDGSVYRQLGFAEDGYRAPVMFAIDRSSWTRTPITCHSERSPEMSIKCHSERSPKMFIKCHSERSEESASPAVSYYRNLGSIKFRLTPRQQG